MCTSRPPRLPGSIRLSDGLPRSHANKSDAVPIAALGRLNRPFDNTLMLTTKIPTPLFGQKRLIKSSIPCVDSVCVFLRQHTSAARSEEHTSELQSLMRISYAVFCLKK